MNVPPEWSICAERFSGLLASGDGSRAPIEFCAGEWLVGPGDEFHSRGSKTSESHRKPSQFLTTVGNNTRAACRIKATGRQRLTAITSALFGTVRSQVQILSPRFFAYPDCPEE
jgi:hypothetical protein